MLKSFPSALGKLAGLDKKLSRSLEASVVEGSSPDLGSPMGPLAEATRSERAALYYAIIISVFVIFNASCNG